MPKGRRKRNPQCSFCGKYQSEGVRLITGPRAKICNECVQLCYEIIHDRAKLEPPIFPPDRPLQERLAEFRKSQSEKK